MDAVLPADVGDAPMRQRQYTPRDRGGAVDDELHIEDGSLYPALYRLEQRGFIEAEWGTSELGRKAKFTG